MVGSERKKKRTKIVRYNKTMREKQKLLRLITRRLNENHAWNALERARHETFSAFVAFARPPAWQPACLNFTIS